MATELTQETLPLETPNPQTDRFRIYKMSRSIWAVHDTTKPYGSRATFFHSVEDAEAFVARSAHVSRSGNRSRKGNSDG